MISCFSTFQLHAHAINRDFYIFKKNFLIFFLSYFSLHSNYIAHAINRDFYIFKRNFLIFAQNIDCGYSLENRLAEAVLTSTHNLCFGPKRRKIGI